MADSKVSEIFDSNEAEPKSNLIIYVVDPDETTDDDKSKAVEFGSLIDSIITMNGSVVVMNGNVVIRG
jgi:hypothetical protein